MIQKVKNVGAFLKKNAWAVGGAVGATLTSVAAHAQTLFTLPDASSTFTGVGQYSGPTFSALLPLAYIIVGFMVGALIVTVVIRSVIGGVEKITGKGRTGGRRGRRR